MDDGYVNTGSAISGITFLDGEQGILRYRGYPIEQLAERSDFVETSYLLIYGELPTKEQLRYFRTSLQRHTMLHEEMKSFYDGFPRDAHPMAILSSVVGALSTFYQDSLDPRDPRQVEVSVHRLMAKLPTIAAYSYQKIDRAAVHVSAERFGLLLELFVFDVRRAVRDVRGRSRFCRGAESAVHRACRSRAELQHQHGADGRLERRQPVRLDLGRHLRAVGPAARRGQPGLRGNAGSRFGPTAAM